MQAILLNHSAALLCERRTVIVEVDKTILLSGEDALGVFPIEIRTTRFGKVTKIGALRSIGISPRYERPKYHDQLKAH